MRAYAVDVLGFGGLDPKSLGLLKEGLGKGVVQDLRETRSNPGTKEVIKHFGGDHLDPGLILGLGEYD